MLRLPESMDECVYFTNRSLGEKGHAKVWVFRKECAKCSKGLMQKPVDKKTGKFKVRAKEYVCSECGNSMDKDEYEPTLEANIVYTCPECEHDGEQQIPFKRKKIKGIPTLQINCDNCGSKIDITKKMKEAKS